MQEKLICLMCVGTGSDRVTLVSVCIPTQERGNEMGAEAWERLKFKGGFTCQIHNQSNSMQAWI